MNGAAPLVLSQVPPSVRRLLDVVGLEAVPGIEVEDDG
jgi:anti-anti-sigma regulatory factor